jgi:hypothetical protein
MSKPGYSGRRLARDGMMAAGELLPLYRRWAKELNRARLVDNKSLQGNAGLGALRRRKKSCSLARGQGNVSASRWGYAFVC